MRLQLVLLGTCCLFAATCSQGYNNRGLNEVHGPPYRRPITTQQHILSDVQQHQQRYNVQQNPQQQFYVQQSPSVEVPLTQQQHQQRNHNVRFPQSSQQQQQQQLRAPASSISSISPQDPLIGFVPSYVSASQGLPSQPQTQQQQQFQRSVHNQVQQPLSPFPTGAIPTLGAPPQQEQDIHTQNFLTLRNIGPQVGPQQSLPSRSFSNKPFQQQGAIPLQSQFQHQPQPLLQQPVPQQFSTVPQFKNGLSPAQTEQKLPRQEVNQAFSTAPQFQFNNGPQAQAQVYHPQPSSLPPSHPSSHPPQQQPPHSQQIFPTNPQPQFLHSSPPHHSSHPHHSSPPHNSGPHYSSYPGFPHFEAPVASPEQEYKQKLIQKHEQFVQKQYEKSQNKVKQLHEDFVHKQHSIKQEAPVHHSHHHSHGPPIHGNPPRSRPVYPSELDLFNEALKKYHIDHPTTTTTTTTQATTSSVRPIQRPSKPEGEKIKSTKTKVKPAKTIGRDELLKQLKAALAEAPQKDLGDKPFEEMDLVLPNGERVQVIRTKDPNLIKGQKALSQDQLNALISGSGAKSAKPSSGLASVAPNKAQDLVLPDGHKVQIVRAPGDVADDQGGLDLSSLANLYGGGEAASGGANSLASSAVISSNSDEPPSIEELARRGLIPEGYEIEGLSSKPKAAPAPAAPPKKKATYVYLEEQADGSFKIQGVKANGEKETKTSGAEVESILERIRSGEIKLPPSVTRLILPDDQEVTLDNGKIVQRSIPTSTTTTTTTRRPTTTSTTTTTTTTTTTPAPFTIQRPKIVITRGSQSPYSTTVSPLIQRSSDGHLLEEAPSTYRSTVQPLYQEAPVSVSYATTPQPIYEQTPQVSSTYAPVTERLTATTSELQQQEQPVAQNLGDDLLYILKSNGLFAMAKYLKQSGLDSILNETGPYTIFVPTDKAFKNLLIQLGGPERAEEKFKSNPRLLSGLLLHHVIPGAFEISSLQDEMTGVSLAGTQLRVNQYTMHDQEWNDVVLTTINGAMVVNDRKDIKIPQGIAHAVDRVMFPLPVGDLLQTLQSDREARFATFLKVLYTSGLSEKLQGKGVKTYTVFAPTEKAFKDLESDVLEKLLTDKEAAEEFATKHIVPGTLFSAGMRFYQVKDSLLTGKTVILQKTSAGKIKVNDSQMVTSNIPATNGVIHAIDGVLS